MTKTIKVKDNTTGKQPVKVAVIKAEVTKVLEELKTEGIITSFSEVEVTCKHQNLEDNNGVIKCLTCDTIL